MNTILHPDAQMNHAVVGVALINMDVFNGTALPGDPRCQAGDDGPPRPHFSGNNHPKLTRHRWRPVNMAYFFGVIAYIGQVMTGFLVNNQALTRADMTDDRIARDRPATAGKGN